MESKTGEQVHVQEPQSPGNVAKQPRRRRGWIFAVVLFLVFAGILVSGILQRVHTSAALRGETTDMAVPTVSVVAPQRAAPLQEIVLPGNVQPYIQSPIFSRTNGYLRRWYFDIGAHVKKGQLLAEIESPEVDQQLQQAQADLKTAQANLALAKITADRWQGLLKTNSVSQQETDQAVGNYHAMQATLDSQAANVRRLEQLQSFEKIYAPFDGVLTARNTDIGALINAGASTPGLINAGASTPGQGLFTLAAIDKLRVFVTVPEVY